MEPWYESSNNSRDLLHLSSKKKKKIERSYPNRHSNSTKKRKRNDVVIHKSRELK